jgi:hypothetical protein
MKIGDFTIELFTRIMKIGIIIFAGYLIGLWVGVICIC